MAVAPVKSRTQALGDRLLAPVREAGQVATFSGQALMAIAASGRYFAEILRQCSVLILGSSVVLIAMIMVLGGECGLFITYLTRPLQATATGGTLMNPCGTREMFPYMFAYIFAAKVGCGLVAEIGSMRISDEIAAMESVGIDPMRYVIGTRLVAIWLCVPLVYAVGMVAGVFGGYLVEVVQFGNLSGGQYFDGFFAAQTVTDTVISFLKMFTMATAIGLVAMYYGYRARGGPVGVGDAVARAMMINLVLIHVIGGAFTSVFYGVGKAGYPWGG